MVDTALLQTFLINGGTALAFFLVALSVLKRSGIKRISGTFALFFITIAIGLIVNVVYRIINEEYWNIVLNKVTIYFSALGVIFLYEFNLLIRFSENEITLKRQIVLFVIYALLLSFLFFIADGVTWDYSPGIYGVPVWSPLFAWYGGLLCQGLFVLILYTSAKISAQFSDIQAKKKYRFTIVAILMFDFILVGNFVANGLNIPIVRTIFLVGSGISIVFGTYWLYQGTKRNI